MARRAISNPLGEGRTRGLKLIMAAAVVALGPSVGPVNAQPQGVQARVTAAEGQILPNHPVWETHIAAGPDEVIAVFNVKFRSSLTKQVGYAVLDQSGWREDLIEMGPFDWATDPSIAVSYSGGFLAAALVGGPADIAVSSYPDPNDPDDFEPWRAAVDLQNGGADKPWLVAGAPGEYYILFTHDPAGQPRGYDYLRSTDGGENWCGGPVTVNGSRVLAPVGAWAAAQPAVFDNGPLYVAYHYAGDKIRFLVGVDVNDCQVQFAHLMKVCAGGPGFGPFGGKPPLQISLNVGNVRPYLPLPYNNPLDIKTTPQVAVDPADPRRLYVVYHDTDGVPDDPPPADVNVDVFLQVFEGAGTAWCPVGDPVTVNDPEVRPGVVTDNYLPALTVAPDPLGGPSRVHVIFYDDRRYPGQVDGFADPPPAVQPQFDVYYTYSTDGGATFSADELLFLEEDEPVLDYNRDVSILFEPGEYIGITYYVDASREEIWTSYTGTYTLDTLPDQSVIWSSLILPPWA